MLYRKDDDEKRDFARMGLECAASFRVDGEEGSYNGVVMDLSAIGMRLVCSSALPVGVRLELEMTPEKAIVPPLQVKAEVLRCEKDGQGSYQLGLAIVEILPGL